MADIDIVPKRRTSAWLWVAIVLILLAIVFFWLLGSTGTANVGALTPDRPIATAIAWATHT